MKPLDYTILAKSAALIIAFAPVILIMTFFLEKQRIRELMVLPGLCSLVASLSVVHLAHDTVSLRSVFCALSIATFIMGFSFVLYFERIRYAHYPRIELTHRRYLKYLRTFCWAVAFILVGYLAWEFQAFGHSPQEVAISIAMPPQLPSIVGLLQLAVVFGLGFMLVGYAFHSRLKEIEQLREPVGGGNGSGTFRYPIEIGPLAGEGFERVEALVDSGTTYTWAPRSLLERLGVSPLERQVFILADDRRAEYDMAQLRVRLDGRERFTICIFGDEDTIPLLGSLTLEGFGLGVDPVNRRLNPVPGYLLASLLKGGQT